MDEAVVARIRQSIASGATAQPQQQQQPSPAQAAPAEADPNDTALSGVTPGEPGARGIGLKDVGNMIVGGARDALQATWDTASAIGPAVSRFANRSGLNVMGLPEMQQGDGPQLPEVPKADEGLVGGTAANMARDVERFLLGFVGGGMALRGLGVATNTFKGAAAAGAVGDFFVTGTDDKRLVDLFESIPALQGPVLEALQTDGSDNLWAHKLASAAEGVLFGAGIEGLVRGVGAIRKVIAAQRTGDPKAVKKAVAEVEPELQEALKEIRAWHGSPHEFDKMELRPLSGEGTEAFGRGVYVAENKEVGKFYAKLPNEDMAKSFIVQAGGDVEQAVKLMREDVIDKKSALHSRAGSTPEEYAERLEAAIRKGDEGSLYELKVKHSADDLLDWDAPIQGQVQLRDRLYGTLNYSSWSDEAKAAFEDVPMTGEKFYRHLSEKLGGDEAASKALLDAGVPGLRFLDAGSRDAGEGTRNMVLFDPESVEILSRNGQPITPRKPVEMNDRGQIEMFPEVVRREEAIQDIQLQIKGDRYLDPETGKEKILPVSNRAREELTTAFKDPSSPVHLDKLTPETREELLRALASDNEAARFFSPKTVRGKPFALDDARRGDFEAALERSLTVPYATLKSANPGTAIEDTLSTFLNYRYMDSADAVKVALEDMANVMKPLVDKHVGGFPQTFEKVTELADWLSMKPDTLTALLSQQSRAAEYMPAMVVAAKTWVQSLARDIHQISRAIDQGIATDTAKIELVRRQDILADLVSTLKAVQTSSARTTAAGRIRTADQLTHEEIGTLLKEVGEDNFRYLSQKLSLTEGNPGAVIRLLEPTFGQKFWGVSNEYWINALLSGFGTHVVNFVSGARNTLLYPSFRFVGGALTGDKRSMSVALGQYAGLKASIFESMEMAWRALKTENAYVDASFHQVERERLWIKADTFGLDGGDALGKGVEFLGTAVRMSSRFLTASDEFLKQINYRASVRARATTEAYERGLKDDVMVPYFVDGEKRMISQIDEYVRDRMHEAFHPRLEHGLDQAALADARKATFTQPLREATHYNGPTLGEVAQQAAAKIPPLRHGVLPFVRVPVNIFREMIYESPAAPIRAQFWQDVKAGGEARADAIGRLTMGSLFWSGTAMLAAEGLITGKGPTDPTLNAQWRLDGKQPYSIKFPGMGPDGKDLWIDYARLGDQWAGMLGIAADAAYIMAHVDERTQDKIATTLTLSLAHNLNSRGYLRSLTELSAVLSATGNPQGPNAVQRWLNSRAGSYVPRIVDSMNPDDTMREARDMLDAIYAKTPFLSNLLEAKVDNFGVPMAPQVGWPINEINPFKISLAKSGAARRELAYWSESPVKAQFEIPSKTIDGVIDLRDFKNAETGQSAWSRWMQVLTEPKWNGKTFEEHIDGLASSDGYKELKKAGKEDPIYRKHPAVEFLRGEMLKGYKQARDLMLQEKGFEPLAQALAQYEASKDVVPVGASLPPNPTLEQLLKDKR